MKTDISKEHFKYLKGLKKEHATVRFLQIAILVIFIVCWELFARMKIIDDFLLSSPSKVLKALVAIAKEGTLLYHFGVTLYETLLSFFIGGLLGVIGAILLWWSPIANKVFDPYLVVLNSLPKIALGPIIIVWVGAGIKSIVAMGIFVSVIVTIVTILSGFMQVPKEKILLMKTLGATKMQILKMVVLPASLPVIVTALKLNIGMSWVGVIVGEFLVSKAGLGYLIVYGGQVFRLDLVMGATLLLCIAAAGMNSLITLLENKLAKKFGHMSSEN